MNSNSPLTDVATYLQDAGIGLTLGVNLFASMLPDSPDTSVALIEYPGAEGDEAFGLLLPAVEESRFQVLVRDTETNYPNAESQMDLIYRTVRGVVNTEIGGTQYLYWQAMHTPALFQRDEARRVVLVLNFYTLRTPQ